MNKLLSILTTKNLIMHTQLFNHKFNPCLQSLFVLLMMLFSGTQLYAQVDNLSVGVNVGNVSCPGGTDGIIAAEPDGGAPQYTYLWSNGLTDQIITGLNAGTYTVTVTDQLGATATATGTVTEPVAFSLLLEANYETCAGSNDAKASVQTTGGTFPYSYLWSDGQTDFIATGLSAGTYTVTVTDAAGCTTTGSVLVELSPEGVWIMLSSTPACGGGSNGTAYVGAMTGTAPYSYVWNNGDMTNNPTGLSAGTYTVTVTDANGCSAVDSVAVGTGPGFTLNLNANFETCTGSNDAQASVEVVGGTFPYTYQWSNGQDTFFLTGLSAGTYTVTVTDAVGCTAVDSIEVQLSPEGVWIMLTSTPACDGSANGTAHVSPMTGTAPYTYVWSNGNMTADPTGLAAGPYTVTVTDANGCSAVDSVTVGTAPGFTLAVDATAVSCAGNNDGQVSATPTGGAAPYTYLWNNGQTTASLTGLSAATYTVVVTDSNGCSATGQATVTSPSAITADVDITNTACNQSTGSITLSNIAGGTPAYTYNWSTSATTSSITGLPVGTYGVTITDANGCTSVYDGLTVGDDCPPACPTDAGTLTADGNPVCLVNGSATISATPDGNAVVPTGFQTIYVLTSNPGLVIQQTNTAPTFTVNAIGSYTIHTLVYDPNTLDLSIITPGVTTAGEVNSLLQQGGGTICASLDVNGAPISVTLCGCTPPIVSNVVVIEANCGKSDGSITINVANGPAGFDYAWTPNVSSNHIATGLPAGTYTIIITDSNDATCQITEVHTVGTIGGPEVELVQKTNATCKESNGTATFSPIGFEYVWSNGELGHNATMLPAGQSQVTVTDPATQCFTVETVFIETFNPLMARDSIEKRPTCNASDGIVSILVTGGSFNYSYEWNGVPGPARRTDLPSGTYTVKVIDNGPTGCERIISFVLTDDVPGANLTLQDTVSTSCPGKNDAMAIFSYTLEPGFAIPETVTIINTSTNMMVANGALGVGNYCIEIRDANNCLADGACFTVVEPTQIDIDVAIVDAGCIDKGSITLETTGGVPGYTYDWEDLAGTNNIQNRTGLMAGSYSFTVTDANGCTAFANDIMVDDSCTCVVPVVESVVVIESECGQSTGNATINVVGGSNNYSYTWEPNVSASFQAMNLAAGVYTVTITDLIDPDCAVVEIFTINNEDGPDSPFTMTPADCGASNGSVTFDSTSYQYVWSDGVTGNPRTDLMEGVYFVTITDPLNPTCPGFLTVVVDETVNLLATATVETEPDCNTSNGIVTINAIGVGPFDYVWSDTTLTTATRGDLPAGIYTVQVIDKGTTGNCQSQVNFLLIDDVDGVDVNIEAASISTNCVGSGDATVDFTFNFSGGFVQPASIRIEDSNGTNYVNGSLPPGDYCIIIRDGNGCVAGGDCFEVTSPTQIDLDLAVFDADCGELGVIRVTQLSGGTPGYTFNWQDLSGTDNMQNRDSLSPGTYYLTVTDDNDCSLAIALDVNGTDSLDINVTDDMVSCNSMETLIASSSNSSVNYVWVNQQGDTLSQTSNLNVSDPGTYLVFAESNGCLDSDSVKVDFSGAEVNVDGNMFICQDIDAQLNVINVQGDSLTTYTWTPSNLIASGEGTDTVTLNTSTPGGSTIYVEVTNEFGCTDIDSFTVAIIDTTVSIITDRQCEALTIDFSTNGDNLDYYLWNFGDPNSTSDTSNLSDVTYTYSDTGTYTITLTVPQGALCLTDTITTTVEVFDDPLFDVNFGFEYDDCSETATIAFSDSSSSILGEIITWEWNFSNDTSATITDPVITVDGSQNLEATLIVTTAAGCIDSITQSIDVNLIELNLADIEACLGATEIELYEGADTNYVYDWIAGTGILDPSAPNAILDTALTNGIYIVEVSDSAGICSVSDTLDLTVRMTLQDLATEADSVNVCTDDPAEVSATSADATSYIWSTTNIFSDTLGTSSSQMVTPGDRVNGAIYYVEAKDDFGCTAIDSVLVTNYGLELSFSQPEYVLCKGDETDVLLSLAPLVPSPSDSIVIVWDPSAVIVDDTNPTSPTVTATETTTLSVQASNRFGCVDSAEVELRVIDLDNITLTADPDTSCERGSEVNLLVTEIPGATYDWMTSTGETVNNVADPIVRPDADTKYDVIVTEPENMCTAERSITITVVNLLCEEPFIFFPNAFTPNGDGKNDVLKVEGFNIDEVNWIIYNRWGEKMFEANAAEQSWDGTFKGKQLSSDVYGYYLRVRCTDGQEFKKQGNVSLLR